MKKIEIEIPEGYEFNKETMSVVPIKDNMEYIDLDLPSKTLWAKCNIGANEPEEYGDNLNFEQSKLYNCPSKGQFKELMDECSWIWCTINGIHGYIVIGKNGNYIFLPAAGYRDDANLYLAGSYGCFWSSSLSTDYSSYAWYLSFDSGNRYMSSYYRYYGHSVRPVKSE